MKYKKRFFLIAILLVIISLVLIAYQKSSGIFLHQFYVQKEAQNFNTITGKETWDTLIKSRLSYFGEIFEDHPATFDYENPESVFRYVFSRFPKFAVVYPTETYYYWQVKTPEIEISGNIRLLDADKGIVYLGYFNKNEVRGTAHSMTLSKENGLLVKDLGNHLFSLSYGGLTRTFKVNDLNDTSLNQPSTALLLQSGEEVVARIFDESGVKFYLIFNSSSKSFYYIVDESNGIPDTFKTVAPTIIAGDKTGFLFYEEIGLGRKYLVGVSSQNIMTNSYFDGPFDQVPPRLEIKKMLNAAYPYTLLYEGIDEHGNFLIPWQAGSRVAISPYQDYFRLNDVLQYYKNCDTVTEEPLDFLHCLTYEKKSHFEKTLTNPTFEGKYEVLMRKLNLLTTPVSAPVNTQSTKTVTPASHAIYVSQGWPANHQADKSRLWPQDHTSDVSSVWPKNHLTTQSTASSR